MLDFLRLIASKVIQLLQFQSLWAIHTMSRTYLCIYIYTYSYIHVQPETSSSKRSSSSLSPQLSTTTFPDPRNALRHRLAIRQSQDDRPLARILQYGSSDVWILGCHQPLIRRHGRHVDTNHPLQFHIVADVTPDLWSGLTFAKGSKRWDVARMDSEKSKTFWISTVFCSIFFLSR